MIKCECCRRGKATVKDYRYISSIQCQGKTLVCKYCFNLTDVDFVEEWCRQL